MRANQELLDLFFGQDPYAGFDHTALAPDHQGWSYENPVLYEAVRLLAPRLVVEVGTWKGASAIRMAKTMQKAGTAGVVVCVDTWLGGAEHFLIKNDPAFFPSLRMRHGYPRLYEQFLANVLHAGVADRIVPLPQTSHNAALILSRLGLSPQMVYLDGSHEYTDVYLDLSYYWELLAPGGLILGDDYHQAWPGVTAAARTFAREQGTALDLCREKFVVCKGRQPGLAGLVPAEDRYWDPEAAQYRPLEGGA